ncbi:hypothetical protein [Halohasta litorea]|uniref:Uncharacterized protein n=1 Tax=Halohasta litorea TaxID=869891 RepID=A0ABD6DCL8_9EURY|nr:hypothetical protein [Halohasta litorea]
MGSDRFSELSDMEAQSRQQDDDVDPEPETEPKSESTTSEPEPKSQPDATGNIHETAFNYDEAKQSPIYARPSTWDEYDDALELDIERSLRKQDVRNASKRELHDATLRLAAENPELVAEKLLEARRQR